MSLFVVANHMLVLYSLLYLIGDFLRAFFYRSDSSSDAVGISVLFFFLSIWLFLNSIIYFRAFMHELETYSTSGGSSVEGTGVASANTEMTVGGGDQQITSAQSKNETTMQIWKRWTYYLRTEVGLAYFLNIVGSAGYVLSSLISMFLTMGTTFGARDVDRASLFLDVGRARDEARCTHAASEASNASEIASVFARPSLSLFLSLSSPSSPSI